MPCTFSHPLAVVSLRRLCSEPFSFAALVIGSMSPDFGYYIGQFRAARFAHTVPGLFAVCLPSGLLAVGLFCLLRRPLCFMLPQPHRAALMPLALRPAVFSVRFLIIAAACLLFGAWTHIVWDGFTHEGGWAVERFAFLRAPVVQVRTTTVPVSYVLQQMSTVVAALFLAVLYLRWLRRQPETTAGERGSLSDGCRYVLLGLLATSAAAFGIPSGLRIASFFKGYLAFRVFVFRAGVYSAAVFIPLLVVAAISLYAVNRRRARAMSG